MGLCVTRSLQNKASSTLVGTYLDLREMKTPNKKPTQSFLRSSKTDGYIHTDEYEYEGSYFVDESSQLNFHGQGKLIFKADQSKYVLIMFNEGRVL